MDDQPPSLRDCRSAAKAAREADRGRAALRDLRPRGNGLLYRSRPPAWLLLYTAGRAGRLVWRGPDAFALLRPPLRSRRAGGAAVRLLDAADRWWDLLVLTVPAGTALGAALVMALIGGTPGRWAGIVLALLAMAYTCVLLTLFTASGTLWLLRALEGWHGEDRETREALHGLLADNWTVELWHGPGDRAMAAAVLERAGGADAEVAVLCDAARLTDSSALRDLRAHARPRRVGAEEVVILGAGRPGRNNHENAGMSGGLIMLAAAIAVVVLFQADAVAEAERAACAGACAGRAADFGRALSWLLEAVTWGGFSSPYEAVTARSNVLGMINHALVPTFLGCAWVAARNLSRRTRRARERVRADVLGERAETAPDVRNDISGNVHGPVVQARDINLEINVHGPDDR
ncbi:hypothetical protein ACQEU3_09055 [Spirillospora sp. CA-253888]